MINVKVKGIDPSNLLDGDVYFNPDTELFYMWYKNKSYQIPKEIEQLKQMLNLKQPRKRQYYLDKQDKLWNHYIVDLCCSCGANVYHYEYDGNEMYGVCNGCGKDVYVVKEECIDKRLKEGIWK